MLPLNNSVFSFSTPFFPTSFQNCRLNIRLTNAAYKARISVMLISAHMYSENPRKQMLGFSLWFQCHCFPGNCVAFTLNTRCKTPTLCWLCTQTVDESQAAQEARLLCPCQCSPTGCQTQIWSTAILYLNSGSVVERMDGSFLVTPTEISRDFLEGYFFMIFPISISLLKS